MFGKPNTLPQCLQQMAWRCQSGPNSRTLTSAPRSPSIQRWESGLMVGTHLLLDTLFLTSVHLHPLSTDHQALRAPQRGPCASRHITSLPTSSETTFTAEEFRTLLLVRLHLPLHVDDRFCKCGARLDVFGHHRSACSRVGLLKPRGIAAEICVTRIYCGNPHTMPPHVPHTSCPLLSALLSVCARDQV